jgi:acyl carrier protein
MENTIKRILAEELGFKIDKILPNMNLIVDLDMDNFDRIDIMSRIEEECGVSIPHKAEIDTVQDIIDFCRKSDHDINKGTK